MLRGVHEKGHRIKLILKGQLLELLLLFEEDERLTDCPFNHSSLHEDSSKYPHTVTHTHMVKLKYVYVFEQESYKDIFISKYYSVSDLGIMTQWQYLVFLQKMHFHANSPC